MTAPRSRRPLNLRTSFGDGSGLVGAAVGAGGAVGGLDGAVAGGAACPVVAAGCVPSTAFQPAITCSAGLASGLKSCTHQLSASTDHQYTPAIQGCVATAR